MKPLTHNSAIQEKNCFLFLMEEAAQMKPFTPFHFHQINKLIWFHWWSEFIHLIHYWIKWYYNSNYINYRCYTLKPRSRFIKIVWNKSIVIIFFNCPSINSLSPLARFFFDGMIMKSIKKERAGRGTVPFHPLINFTHS